MSSSTCDVCRTVGRPLLVAILCGAIALGLVACGGDDGVTQTTTAVVTTAGGTSGTLGVTTTSEALEGVDAALLGKWHSDQTGETFEFTADGTMVVTTDDGRKTQFNYAADGVDISFIVEGMVAFKGPYSIDGDVLSMVDPDIAGTVFFDRVE